MSEIKRRMDLEDKYHIPVLYDETIQNLITNKNGVYVDCTLGGGGHSEGILLNLEEKGKLISIDQDINAIKFAKERLEIFNGRYQIFQDNFKNIDTVVYMAGYDKVDGILMDIGVSSKQLDDATRGFSYKYNAKLDMRMDQSQELSAYEVVNEYPEEELSRIIYKYGEERRARRIAAEIVRARTIKPIETTDELVGIIKKIIKEKTKKHPAKKVFQAIRIEVNKELEVLEQTIDKAISLLKPGGRLAIITFHSLEDRIVKEKFRKLSKECICPPEIPICVCNHKASIKLITRKPIAPSKEEMKTNRRAHSSKLRVCERI
ncbi:16S rRNA (cytosine1402-N4)-methyltransferase [Hypnocyclicus thermotrophus]|uniref:Ribosomal RNA small subunit methyltransferase H n=1 Tax=Hypnocyclicus thermotrophus TaxID=1627895 RepID=A0AA46I5W3_9FUSO|nr:16S rRNA (cytosine(1402)-N(4))-methyltransferase RsmH [Hypnocyclicus thermotrophus]TDT71564.1 16S rRNA (cytosine1402-N4)-methyltransferase [Hypnocyclicus thermotrophus]